MHYNCLKCGFTSPKEGNCPTCNVKMYYTDKPLMFPKARNLSDLFEAFKAYDLPMMPNAKGNHPPEFKEKTFSALIYTSRDKKRANVPIRSFCSVHSSRGGYRFLLVSPNDALVKAIAGDWIGDAERDSVSFEIVCRNDGTALVLSKNSLIIASRYIALLSGPEVWATAKVK